MTSAEKERKKGKRNIYNEGRVCRQNDDNFLFIIPTT